MNADVIQKLAEILNGPPRVTVLEVVHQLGCPGASRGGDGCDCEPDVHIRAIPVPKNGPEGTP
jgi:hypothetical protein